MVPNALGEDVLDWTSNTQAIQGNIQPKRGQQSGQPEGLVAEATHILYCNYRTQQIAPKDTDIAFGDRIVDKRGQQYRVVFVDDEAGQGDHLKVYLKTIGAEGD